MNVAAFIYAVVKAVPKVKEIFDDVQSLYYDELFKKVQNTQLDYIGRRRALSNSIEMAKTNEDRKHLSIMLASLHRELSDGHK